MRTTFFAFILFNINILLAQAPGTPFHPMTANGARHIHLNIGNLQSQHKLFWKNPPNVTYNEIYLSKDSTKVKNLDPSVRVLSGYDSSIVYDSMSLAQIGSLELHTKYYWCVVEYNSFGFTAGPVWYFISQSSQYSWWNDEFNNNLSNYTIRPLPPQGARWEISSSSTAGRQPPELKLYDWLGFWGTGYLILNEIFDLSPSINLLGFNYSIDWQSGQFTIGIAYSLDEGMSWIPIWQKVVTQDIPPSLVLSPSPNENYVKLALFYSSTDPNANGACYFDDLGLGTPLTVPTPPAQIQAKADSFSLSVKLNWTAGYGVDPIVGYRIQRKNGFPMSPSVYYTIANVGPSPLYFEDLSVKPDSIYTYRIQTILAPTYGVTACSNEATAYIPSVVPVELLSFSYSHTQDGVLLVWITATETNNKGFEIQRMTTDDNFQSIGFVGGHGTTTEEHSYSFTDRNVSQGKYFFRLKQIDFDGTVNYSNEIEVEVNHPTKFALDQNYPNPFNPSTKIKFNIPIGVETRHGVSLRVYDVLGNEIATLVDEYKPAGTYEVEFSVGQTFSLSSGIYYYQLRAGDFVQSRKMILLK